MVTIQLKKNVPYGNDSEGKSKETLWIIIYHINYILEMKGLCSINTKTIFRQADDLKSKYSFFKNLEISRS